MVLLCVPEKPSKATVFLINDNHGAFQRAFPFAGSGSNRSAGCEAVMEASTATIFASADTGRIVGTRALRGSEPTKWVAVAVDCSHPQPTCPNISQAVVTMYHPNSETEPDSCRFSSQGALGPLLQLRELMSEVSQMPWPDPLQVVGVVNPQPRNPKPSALDATHLVASARLEQLASCVVTWGLSTPDLPSHGHQQKTRGCIIDIHM